MAGHVTTVAVGRVTAGRVAAVAVTLALWGCLASGSATAAHAATAPTSTAISAGFVPDEPGAASTMELGFKIRRPGGSVPPPLIGVDFRLPAGVSLTTSELGLDSCDPNTLASAGSEGCKPDAVMGHGSALMLAPNTVEALSEPVGLTILMGQAQNRHTTLLFYADGGAPVIAQVVFVGQLVEASGPFGADLATTIPLTAGLPGEPDVTVVEMHSSIGSKGVTYYKRVHGVRVAYHPKGLIVPRHCPPGGFPFAASFRFADGTSESASTTAPCPTRGAHAHRPQRRSK
jgi:hypothetical protein